MPNDSNAIFFHYRPQLDFLLVVFPKVFLVAKKSFTFASRPKSQLEKTFWTSKQENMFYCLVFFLKHLYNTYTIVQNVDRYYIGVPYLEGIMDFACKQGSLSEVCGRHHMTSEKNSPKQTTPSICIRPDDDFGYTQNPTFCAGQHGKFFIAQPQKIFLCTYT